MQKIRVLIASSALLLASSGYAIAEQADQLVGPWCFYEQSGFGQTFPEKVDIVLNSDRTYLWQEGAFKQEGTWEVAENSLRMSDVGSHRIVSIKDDQMELERMSIMRFRKGTCRAEDFSDQDIIRFQNAASTGEIGVMQALLDRGMDIDIVDWRRGDTALIKAAKFCEVEAARYLLAKGADTAVKSDEDKTALDYARASNFHKGCDELVSTLQ